MSDFFDRQGQTMTLDQWAKTAEDRDYKTVARTEIDLRGESILVSTVWLGLDHSFGDGPPLIFETMVFRGALDEEQERYSTEAEAVAGHAAMCAKVRAL